MKIAYLVDEDSDPTAALAHVRALTDRGHDAEIVDMDSDTALDDYEFIVGTSERTVATATSTGRGVELWPAPIVDRDFYRTRPAAENQTLRVLLAGAYGLEDSYGAAAHARWFHQKFDLIRVSRWAPSREEPLESVQEFHVGLSEGEMVRLIHTCDVVLDGAAVAPAIAAGLVPVLVAPLAMEEARDYALFAPAGNPVELGERLIEVLSDFELRDKLRGRGRSIAERWRSEVAGEALEHYFVDQRSVRQR